MDCNDPRKLLAEGMTSAISHITQAWQDVHRSIGTRFEVVRLDRGVAIKKHTCIWEVWEMLLCTILIFLPSELFSDKIQSGSEKSLWSTQSPRNHYRGLDWKLQSKTYLLSLGPFLRSPPYKPVGSTNLRSGWGLFLCVHVCVCSHRNSPNYICPIFRRALNSHGCTYSYCNDLCCNTPADN